MTATGRAVLRCIEALCLGWVFATSAAAAAPSVTSASNDIHDTAMEFAAPANVRACLTSTQPERPVPSYPKPANEAGAIVRVKLNFIAKDAAPGIDITFNSGGEAYAVAVREFVSNYRLPCLGNGKTFVALQEFQFLLERENAQSLVFKSTARFDADAGSFTKECMAGIDNVARPRIPEERFNFSAPLTGGLVLTRLTFTAPDRAPAIEILYDGGQHRLAAQVRANVSQYRMPCLLMNDEPVVATRLFKFVLGDEPTPRLKADLTLMQFLGAVQGIATHRVNFDFTTMACPFQVDLSLLRPYSENYVRELGERNPNRREFVEWLRGLTFTLPASAMKTTIGQQTTVTVPCVRLDLT